MDEVAKTGEEIVITRTGKPVSKLVSAVAEKRTTPCGAMKGKIKIVGDIISPIDVEWNAEKE